PGFDDVSGDDIDDDLGKAAVLGILLEVVGRVVPVEDRVEQQRQEQVVAVVDHLELGDRTLLRRVEDEVLLGTLGADVALDRELAGDDVFDRDLLLPALAAVTFVAARVGDFTRAAQRAPQRLCNLPGHSANYTDPVLPNPPREGPSAARSIHSGRVNGIRMPCASLSPGLTVTGAFVKLKTSILISSAGPE